MKVLIVDDSQVSREMIQMHLGKVGFDKMDQAKDGSDAIMKVKNLPEGQYYDVITLDVNMPKMDGLAALKQIRQLTPKSKIIMCSSQNDARTVQIAIGFGVHGFVLKPFTAEKLLEVLWSSLKK